MQYQVLVQNPSKQRFFASVVGLPSVMVEGETEEEVIAKVKISLESQLATAKLVTIEVSSQPSNSANASNDPWLKHLSIFAQDPTFDDFLAEVAAYRQQVDDQGTEV
jgi:predicted RNase H-like HicB family nuclease